jgi:hypothetical protein
MRKHSLATGAPWPTHHDDDGLAALLQTETILPTQYWGGPIDDVRSAPERRLLLAVLEDALITLLRHRGRDDLGSRRLVIETEKWVASQRRRSAFDFVGLCDVLRLDPAYIRGLLRQPPDNTGGAPRRRAHAGRGHHKVRTPSRRRRPR